MLTFQSCKEKSPNEPKNSSGFNQVGRFKIRLGEIWDIQVQGNYAFLADIDNGLRIVDISDKTYPVEKLIYGQNDRPQNIFMENSYIFISGIQIWGIDIVNISDPLSPVKITNIQIGEVGDIYFRDTYMFIAAGDQGLLVYDISDISNPEFISSFKDEYDYCRITTVEVVGNNAYLGDDYYAFRILDISNIDSLKQIALIPMDDSVWDLAIQDNYAFLVCGSSGLYIYDITDKNRVEEISSFKPESTIFYNIWVKNDLGFIADLNNSFHAINLQTLTSPKIIDTFHIASPVYNFTMDDNYIYLAAGYEGMYILEFK
jgi:hypothetical protein